MRKLPVNDVYVHNGSVRADGWLMHPFSTSPASRSPRTSRRPWDYYNIEKTIPAEEAAIPLVAEQMSAPLPQFAMTLPDHDGER